MPETLFPLPENKREPVSHGQGKPRLCTANRHQVEIRLASLDELLPEDHRVRIVWAMVQEYDLSRLYERIDAVEGEAGRPAIDPMLLVALWSWEACLRDGETEDYYLQPEGEEFVPEPGTMLLLGSGLLGLAGYASLRWRNRE